MKGYLPWERSSCSIPKDKTKALFTFEQLALNSPKGCDTIVLTGPCKGQERHHHFDKIGRTLHGHPKSHAHSENQKFKCNQNVMRQPPL